MDRAERISDRLREHLEAVHVEVQDDSAKHRGHAGAAGGAGHYTVVVVSQRFAGQSRVARHREIYAALADMMPAEIHALSATAFTKAEWEQRRKP